MQLQHFIRCFNLIEVKLVFSKILRIFVKAGSINTVVEHSPRHPKVQGLTPPIATGNGSFKMAKRSFG